MNTVKSKSTCGKLAAPNYMFYTDKSNGQSKGEILSNQNHTSKGPTA